MISQLIDELLDSGMTQGELAVAVGATQATISRLRAAKQEPSYSLGLRIQKVHGARCGASRSGGLNARQVA